MRFQQNVKPPEDDGIFMDPSISKAIAAPGNETPDRAASTRSLLAGVQTPMAIPQSAHLRERQAMYL